LFVIGSVPKAILLAKSHSIVVDYRSVSKIIYYTTYICIKSELIEDIGF